MAFTAGVALSRVGGSLPAPALLLLPIPPIWASRRPGRGTWVLVGLAGVLWGLAWGAERSRCPVPVVGVEEVVRGRFLAAPRGGAAPFRREGGCGGEIRVLVSGDPVAPGASLRVRGTWRAGRAGPWLLARHVESDLRERADWRWAAVRWRARLTERLDHLYGSRGPLVSALVLARREGLDPEVREAFARSGTAHLLAISGFHVGVIAALGLGLLRAGGVPRRRAELGAAVLVWGYVGFIGFPDAAVRAALILSMVALSRVRGKPPARFGALGTALLFLVIQDPARLESVGFQLSFAGAAGLVAWAPSVRATALRLGRGRCPASVASAVAAGVAATAATLPVVAWHFERISIVGIPATLLASPAVALALPGALLTLLLDLVLPSVALFLAGGVDVLLALLERGVVTLAALPGASVWIPRSWVVIACAGAWPAWWLVGGRNVRGSVRRGVAGVTAVAAIVGWPLARVASGWGTMELVVVDVGQGDAIALRSPAGRWILVDAGPPTLGDPAASRLARWLRRRGVRRLEALVLTHADLDHIGGAVAVIDAVDVGAILDPSLPTGKAAYVDLLEAARARGIPWRGVRAGDRLEIDGVEVEVLHPVENLLAGSETATNDASVVLLVTYGAFDVLLTGDVPAAVERTLVAELDGGIEVLKVAHHGSDTSTDSLLVWNATPQLALISAGRGNRYGHPSPEVLARLARAGVPVRRTDLEGSLRVVARPDGRFQVSVERPRGSGR